MNHVDGVIVIDKPQGPTSHDVVASARRLLGEKRIGHTGTLDPLATGVLPLACGRATRLVRFLVATDKDYEATIRFGIATVSYDITGDVVSQSDLQPSREAVEQALLSLRGEYLQMPPAVSAKKVGGRRAYDLVRHDKPVALRPLPVRVERAEMTSFAGSSATFVLTCSAGFYVRAFAHTLGELTGTGACLTELRRTRSGQFTLQDSVSLGALQAVDGAADCVIPLERLLPRLQSARVSADGRERIAHGRELEPKHLIGSSVEFAELDRGDPLRMGEKDEPNWVRLMDEDGRLLAIGTTGSRPGALHPSIVLI